MEKYTTGEVAQRLKVSKTTIINYISDFNLDIFQNPMNSYREFTHEDLVQLENIHELVRKVGKDQALKEWNAPKSIPKEAGEVIQEAFEGYKQNEQSIKEMFIRQEQINQLLASQQQQIMHILGNLPAENRRAIEGLIVDTLPRALTEALEEKATEIALQREQDKKEIQELKEELKAIRVATEAKDKMVMQLLNEIQESRQQTAVSEEKKGIWARLFGR